MDRAERISDKARALGFDAVGFADPASIEAAGRNLEVFVEEGLHGDMGWMARRLEARMSPRKLWPEVKSVIALAMNYGPDHDPLDTLADTGIGNFSVYARGTDYHDILKKRLKALGRWMVETFGCEIKVFVDTAPVMEKPLAEAAGVGWQGKHTNLVSRQYGSWLFLGAVYTTLEITPSKPHEDRCGACRACIDICPTDAITDPYRIDARRCISYLTIEHKGVIPAEFRPLIGNRVYGCDDCLAVCPWNKFARTAREVAFHAREEFDRPPLDELLELDDTAFRKMFAGSPVKRTGRDRLLRNVLIAAGNSGDDDLLPAVVRRLGDKAPLVRGMAVWALRQLAGKSYWREERKRRLPGEEDAAVRREWTVA